jgi:LPXTG-motif cell wall-anchored protein
MTTTSERREAGGPGITHPRSRFVHPTITWIGCCALALTVGWNTGIDESSSASASGVEVGVLASAATTVQAASNATYGDILTTGAGLALYSLNTDEGGQSTCTGACAAAWPALTVPTGTTPTGGSGVTGTLATAEQANGTSQVTYNGSLLYTFEGDTPGQVTGQGVDGFSVVILAAITTTTTTTSPTSPTTSATTSSTSTTTSTTSIPSSSVGATTTTTSPVAVVSSPSSTGNTGSGTPSTTGNTGSGSPLLASTGPGNDTPVLLLAGVGMMAIGIFGRRRLQSPVRRAKRSRVQ